MLNRTQIALVPCLIYAGQPARVRQNPAERLREIQAYLFV